MNHVRLTPMLTSLALAAVLALCSQPSRAEENRLLPFWAQPYPSGFTRREVAYPGPLHDSLGPARRRCRPGYWHGLPERCPAVLHARG